MQMPKYTAVFTVLAVGLIGLLAASAAGAARSAKARPPIVIGFTIAVTGPNSGFDGPNYDGARIAVDDINKAGGVCGRKLKTIVNDYGSDLSRVVPAAKRIIASGADVVSSSNDYGFGGPADRVANAKNILTIHQSGDPRAGRRGIGPLHFNTFTTTPTEGATMAEFAWSKGWRHPYLLTDTSINYSKSIGDYFKQRWSQLGGDIAGEDSWKNSDVSLAAQMVGLRGASDADVIILSSYPPGASTAVRQIRSAGINTPILGNTGYDSVAWLKSVPDLRNFWTLSYGSIQGDDSYPGRTKLGNAYRKRFGVPGTDYGPILGYSSVQIIAAAIKAAGCSTSGVRMARALERHGKIPTVSGPVRYTSKCHTPSRDLYIARVENGRRIVGQPFHVKKLPPAPC
jgi:branched-chain amino acid transport system substrate-binding protein